MKKSLNSLFVSLILLFFFALAYTGLAQGPPPPPSEKGTEYNHGPAGAPIDGGFGILLILGSAYAAKRVFDARKVLTE
jgi:hypothetical protein